MKKKFLFIVFSMVLFGFLVSCEVTSADGARVIVDTHLKGISLFVHASTSESGVEISGNGLLTGGKSSDISVIWDITPGLGKLFDGRSTKKVKVTIQVSSEPDGGGTVYASKEITLKAEEQVTYTFDGDSLD